MFLPKMIPPLTINHIVLPMQIYLPLRLWISIMPKTKTRCIIVMKSVEHASLQILDSENGQPGPFREYFRQFETPDLKKLDTLEHGRYLMVSKCAVLDMQTRKIWQMNNVNQVLEKYSMSSYDGALAFSPDQKSVVFKALYQTWDIKHIEDWSDSEHALITYNFEKDSDYLVKFDDTNTRMIDFEKDIDHPWFNTYFEWKNSPEGDRLHVRQLEKLPNWTGRYDTKEKFYTLYPVKPEMLPVFKGFVLAQMGWSEANILSDGPGYYSGHYIELGSKDAYFNIVYNDDDQRLMLEKYTQTEEKYTEYEAHLKRIAVAFDAELAAGKHQAHFGQVISYSKAHQIRNAEKLKKETSAQNPSDVDQSK